MNSRVVELVLKKCLGHREGEAVVIVTDTPFEPMAREFAAAAGRLGAETALVAMAPRRNHGEEPPPAVAEAMRSAPVAVLLTSKSLTHTVARRRASEQKVRIASMPGADPRRLEYLLDIDYDELKAREEEIARRLRGARQVRITTPAGTDLSFEIGGRTVYTDCGDLRSPGAFGNLPAGEVCLAPVEGTGKGVLVVDGSVGGSGKVITPITLRFEAGAAVEISDPQLRETLQSHGPLAFSLAEFGIGTNPKADIVGNVLEDEKAIGTAHVALGANASMGGAVQVPIHIDLILLRAAVEIDGVPLPASFLSSPAERSSVPTLPPPAPATGETYRPLFQHNNDAQYILDLESQMFIDVNPAFERMTGYTREDCQTGKITAPRMVARESMTTYVQKRETRRVQPSDRYDLKLICKSGEKKPVEISVQRVRIQDRDMVVGSMRDLTERKRLEQEMWEKIEELGFANSRIFALTEKIRRVPEMTPHLLPITDEAELLERAAQHLCSREGLGYADVSFYLLVGDALELRHSTTKTKKRRLSLASDQRLVRVLNGGDPPAITKEHAILPLKGRDRNIGVLEVDFHQKEIEVLEGNVRALKGYQDLLETLSSVLGLLIENLHLYETVRMQSIVDQLTGVYNRRFLDTKLVDEIGRARRYGRALSLMMIDLDFFKQINDTLGHKQGDHVLSESAQLFRSHTREVDTVCRYGGDEFAILMPETPYEGALIKAENLRREASEREFRNLLDPARPVRLTLSIGITGYTKEIKNPDDILRLADGALYEAKRSGRNRIHGAPASSGVAIPESPA